MKRTPWIAIAGAAVVVTLTSPVRTQGRDQIDRIQDSVQVLRELTQQPDVRIPQHLLERAEAVIVIPDMIRGGFVFGAKHGKGILSVRDRTTDRWSPPAFIKMTGGSVGWQIGAQSVDLVLLVMNPTGVRKLLDNKFTLGADLSATAGPVGRSASAATDTSLESEILAYSRSKGLFAGATFEGVSLRADDDANDDFYGQELTMREIVLESPRDMRVPLVAATWTDAIRQSARSTILGQNGRLQNGSAMDRPVPTGFYDDSAEALTITLLANRPERYYGKRVSLTAPVEGVYSPTAFALEEDTQYRTGRKVIVINPLPSYRLEDRGRVTVVGTMYKFDKGDIEKRLGGWRWDVPSNVLDTFKNHPVVIAESIRATGRELVGAPSMGAMPVYMTPPPGFAGAIVGANEVALHAKNYYNRDVMVTASVESLYSRSIFSVDDDRLMTTGRNVLVVAPGLVRPISGGMDVSVVGALVKFDKGDIEKRLRGYKLDIRDDLYDKLEDQPVIVATSIRTRDGEELVGRIR